VKLIANNGKEETSHTQPTFFYLLRLIRALSNELLIVLNETLRKDKHRLVKNGRHRLKTSFNASKSPVPSELMWVQCNNQFVTNTQLFCPWKVRD